MGDVIPLFKDQPSFTKGDPVRSDSVAFMPEVVLSTELQESIVETVALIEDLWLSRSVEEFGQTVRQIKQRVARWPDDG